MATAKKATKKTAAKKVAAKTAVPKQDIAKETTKQTAPQATLSKQEAHAAKAEGIANATETKKTTNPKGSWPFPTGERP